MTERGSGVTGEKKVSRRAKTPGEAPRQARARALSEILPDVGGAAFRRFGFVQSSVVSRWPEIVGKRYAGVSSPESIRFPTGKRSDGVLTLAVEGAHAPMMQHIAPTLIERVNRFFGYAGRRAGADPPGRRAAAPCPSRRRPSQSSFQPVELGDSLRSIGDPELRAVLESLAKGLSFTTGAPRLPEPSE